jgi:hypothetical protein
VCEGRRIWRANPKIEPHGLDIGGTCGIPLNGGKGRRGDAIVTELGGLEGLGDHVREGRRIWCAKPKMEPSGLDIGGTYGKPPANGSGGWWDAGEEPLEGLGAWGPICTGGAVNYFKLVIKSALKKYMAGAPAFP